jgi:hypothetical protein
MVPRSMWVVQIIESLDAINARSGLPMKMGQPGPCMPHYIALVDMIGAGLAVNLLSPGNDRASYHTIARYGRHPAQSEVMGEEHINTCTPSWFILFSTWKINRAISTTEWSYLCHQDSSVRDFIRRCQSNLLRITTTSRWEPIVATSMSLPNQDQPVILKTLFIWLCSQPAMSILLKISVTWTTFPQSVSSPWSYTLIECCVSQRARPWYYSSPGGIRRQTRSYILYQAMIVLNSIKEQFT